MSIWEVLLLDAEYCVGCYNHTQHELNTQALETACTGCGRVEPVSGAYAARALADEGG